MLTCPNGHEVIVEGAFCTNCGARLIEAPDPNSAAPLPDDLSDQASGSSLGESTTPPASWPSPIVAASHVATAPPPSIPPSSATDVTVPIEPVRAPVVTDPPVRVPRIPSAPRTAGTPVVAPVTGTLLAETRSETLLAPPPGSASEPIKKAICPNGHPLRDGATFCTECGAKAIFVEETAPPVVESVLSEPPLPVREAPSMAMPPAPEPRAIETTVEPLRAEPVVPARDLATLSSPIPAGDGSGQLGQMWSAATTSTLQVIDGRFRGPHLRFPWAPAAMIGAGLLSVLVTFIPLPATNVLVDPLIVESSAILRPIEVFGTVFTLVMVAIAMFTHERWARIFSGVLAIWNGLFSTAMSIALVNALRSINASIGIGLWLQILFSPLLAALAVMSFLGSTSRENYVS